MNNTLNAGRVTFLIHWNPTVKTQSTCWYSLHNDEEIHGQPVLHNTDLFYAIVKVSIFNQHIICQWTWRITVWYSLSKLTLAAKFFFSKRQSKNIKWGQFPECLFQHPKYMIIYGLVERGQKMLHMQICTISCL